MSKLDDYQKRYDQAKEDAKTVQPVTYNMDVKVGKLKVLFRYVREAVDGKFVAGYTDISITPDIVIRVDGTWISPLEVTHIVIAYLQGHCAGIGAEDTLDHLLEKARIT